MGIQEDIRSSKEVEDIRCYFFNGCGVKDHERIYFFFFFKKRGEMHVSHFFVFEVLIQFVEMRRLQAHYYLFF